MPMLDRVIRQVNAIGAWERQGRAFRFLNRHQEPYEWTNEVPEDDPKFQSLLNNKEKVGVYPDISAELQGVELEEDEHNYQMVMDKPKPEFQDFMVAALDNPGINPDAHLRAACDLAWQQTSETTRGGTALGLWLRPMRA
jgi:hypothetical protein